MMLSLRWRCRLLHNYAAFYNCKHILGLAEHVRVVVCSLLSVGRGSWFVGRGLWMVSHWGHPKRITLLLLYQILGIEKKKNRKKERVWAGLWECIKSFLSYKAPSWFLRNTSRYLKRFSGST